jgi:hypothetical protein
VERISAVGRVQSMIEAAGNRHYRAKTQRSEWRRWDWAFACERKEKEKFLCGARSV